MGIKKALANAAGRAADVVAKASVLSPDQLEQIEAQRDAYLSQMPDPADGAAVELTSRLMAACGVEIYDAYLPQLATLYRPVSAQVEHGEPFRAGHNIRFIAIEKWVTDAEENGIEKLVNVYDVLSNEACNIALVFNRTVKGTQAYLAVSDVTNADNNVNADNYARRLTDAVRGNFPGSEWAPEVGRGSIPCLRRTEGCTVATASNVPTEKSAKFVSQTVEKLLDGIVPETESQEYTLVLLATPISDIEERRLRLSEIYSGLAPYASWQTGFTFTESQTAMSMATVGVNVGASAGLQAGQSGGVTASAGTTDSEGSVVTDSESASASHTDATSESTTETESSTRTLGANESTTVGGSAGIGNIGVNASNTTGTSASFAKGSSMADTRGSSTSDMVGSTVGRSVAKNLGRAVARTVGSTAGTFAGRSVGANFGANFARSSSVTAQVGKNESITQSYLNHAVKHALENLDAQMARIEQCEALGMWDFAAYVVSKDQSVASNVAHTYVALTQGEGSFLSRAAINVWRGDLGAESADAHELCEYLKDLRHPLFALSPDVVEGDPTFNVYPACVTATTALSGKELAYSLNFPQRSVAGLPVLTCAEFGRSVITFDDRGEDQGTLRLGRVFHMRHAEDASVDLSVAALASHTFIAGSTGSGKSNAIALLLERAAAKGIRFLVVEPAKGEYKHLFGNDADVQVYGTNPRVAPLLRINPFSFPEGVHVLEHTDRLIEIFNACWPMYAAMPAVLRDAVERSYEDCGWDLVSSVNSYDPGFWPTFSDVERNVRLILDESDYDSENKGAYKGSLGMRLRSLSTGLNRLMLSSDEVPPSALLDANAVVDLSRVGSSETKSLLMGLLVLKLQEHRMTGACLGNAPLWHVTVLEEAHALLRRTVSVSGSESGNLAGKSVESLANAIAEMRTYGEGFVIADQAPGLLDMAVIRNTNTKIVMRLPDLSDRELVGRAANLGDAQIAELAKLPRGVAAVYQSDWIEPVLCKIDKASDPTEYRFCAETGAGELETCESGANDKAFSGKTAKADALLYLVRLLRACGQVSWGKEPERLRGAMDCLGLDASLRACIFEELFGSHVEPQMSRVASIVSGLFPNVRKEVAEAVKKSGSPRAWSEAAEAALTAYIGSDFDTVARPMIIQGVVEDYLCNELHDGKAYQDWEEKGVTW